MTTTNDTTEQAGKIQEDHIMETEAIAATVARASDFVTACIDVHVHEHLPASTRPLWDAGSQLLGDTDATDTRIGFALMLDALSQSPEALATVARDIRARLVDTAPGLEALKR